MISRLQLKGHPLLLGNTFKVKFKARIDNDVLKQESLGAAITLAEGVNHIQLNIELSDG